MRYNFVDFIEMIDADDLDTLLKRNQVQRIELFFNEDHGMLFGVNKGDLDLYWMRKDKEVKEQEKNPFLN